VCCKVLCPNDIDSKHCWPLSCPMMVLCTKQNSFTSTSEAHTITALLIEGRSSRQSSHSIHPSTTWFLPSPLNFPPPLQMMKALPSHSRQRPQYVQCTVSSPEPTLTPCQTPHVESVVGSLCTPCLSPLCIAGSCFIEASSSTSTPTSSSQCCHS
jgi:hypothetical protein